MPIIFGKIKFSLRTVHTKHQHLACLYSYYWFLLLTLAVSAGEVEQPQFHMPWIDSESSYYLEAVDDRCHMSHSSSHYIWHHIMSDDFQIKRTTLKSEEKKSYFIKVVYALKKKNNLITPG